MDVSNSEVSVNYMLPMLPLNADIDIGAEKDYS